VPVPAAGERVLTAVRGACFFRTSRRAMSCFHRRRLSVTRRNQWVGIRPASFLRCCPAV